MNVRSILFFATTILVACRSASPAPACAADQICVNGTVRHFDLEGGFWAVRGDDSTTYDPVGGVPAALQREGLRVRLVARERRDMSSIHMVGRIVEVVSLQELGDAGAARPPADSDPPCMASKIGLPCR